MGFISDGIVSHEYHLGGYEFLEVWCWLKIGLVCGKHVSVSVWNRGKWRPSIYDLHTLRFCSPARLAKDW